MPCNSNCLLLQAAIALQSSSSFHLHKSCYTPEGILNCNLYCRDTPSEGLASHSRTVTQGSGCGYEGREEECFRSAEGSEIALLPPRSAPHGSTRALSPFNVPDTSVCNSLDADGAHLTTSSEMGNRRDDSPLI